jgi:hypothetical protein
MNFAIRTRQLARVFLDAQGLSVDVEQALRFSHELQLATKFSTAAVLPLPVVEVGTPGVARLSLATPDLEWQLSFLGQSFDLVRQATDLTGSNVGEVGDFARLAADLLPRAAAFFGRLPHRLVLAESGMLAEMPSERMEAIAQRLCRFPPSFESQPPFEWDWRVARRSQMKIDDRAEATNVLATVKRVSGVFQMVHMLQAVPGDRLSFDRILVELDVNTTPDDTRGRFQKEGVQAFFGLAIEEHARLANELFAFALGGLH